MKYLSVKNERDGVVSILLFVNEEQAFLQAAGQRVLSARDWTPAQRRRITRMAKGTLERQITIDALISACASRGLEKMHPVAREILRMSTYCLYYMDSMPAHAVINEAVELTKKRGIARLSGFVNGVLRQIRRRQESGADADILIRPQDAASGAETDGDIVDETSWCKTAQTYYAVPAWIIRQWCDDYGRAQTQSMLEALYGERPLTARVNTARTSRDDLIELWRAEGIKCDIIKELKTGISFLSTGSIEKMPGFGEGLFYVQDFGSILATEIVPLAGGERVLDLCAAPGGKATAIAERLMSFAGNMADEQGRTDIGEVPACDKSCSAGEVLACDRSTDKLPLIRANAARLGLPNLRVAAADATERKHDLEQVFDVVIADVPCSGLGVIGRKPDIKLRLEPEDITSLLPLQRAIAENAYSYVKPGGHLLYATCTISRRENEEQVRHLLETYPELELTPFSFDGEETDGMLQLMPGRHESDGFFMALMRRR